MKCNWCDSSQATSSSGTVYWELPDGTKAVTITETPSVNCGDCGMKYQEDTTVKEIEDQLFLINTKELEAQLSYKELMAKPRLLKRNYFDFSS
ncbi:YokU family protein [Sutcliffiella horikoshii]|uniref:YokU family protein n=1 Tax=Sutcliffiella horikoshii TaxID=79883 RepID=A0A5D4SKB9_9BACI|nr:YokU family protein [Sutcliffiella horikoshii]TYS63609.1 YokU family protein [Sutcliffiella horikoshii]